MIPDIKSFPPLRPGLALTATLLNSNQPSHPIPHQLTHTSQSGAEFGWIFQNTWYPQRSEQKLVRMFQCGWFLWCRPTSDPIVFSRWRRSGRNRYFSVSVPGFLCRTGSVWEEHPDFSLRSRGEADRKFILFECSSGSLTQFRNELMHKHVSPKGFNGET